MIARTEVDTIHTFWTKLPCARIGRVKPYLPNGPTHIPLEYEGLVAPMRTAQAKILEALQSAHINIEKYPVLRDLAKRKGIAAAKAFSMQGILKYHGMTDWDWRIAYMPSLSVNNDAAYCVALVEFDPDLHADIATIGGKPAYGRPLERIVRSLSVLRDIAGINSHARVISKNVVRSNKTGKGLGTSAAASAAIAAAATSAVFGQKTAENSRFVSCLSRLLAGSGCRSAVGGVALWLSHPGISHEDSFAIRLDNNNELKHLRLITIPLPSRADIMTESAHHDAPNSILYKSWMHSRCDDVLECIAAVQEGNWRTLAQMAELDSMRLHGITMSGNRENKTFAWEPENMALFRLCNDLRSSGIPVYSSTDTGPTTVFMTHKDYEKDVLNGITELGLDAIPGRIAGPVVAISPEDARNEMDE